MKNTVLYLLFVALVLSGCSKDDDPVFDQTPDERINQALAEYQAALVAAPNGWNARIVTGTGDTFQFHFRFNDKNRVTMYADIDTTTSGAGAESSYRLKALQQPALIFDTYSYLHILSDPDGSVNGGTDGEGLKADFEFSIDTVTADSILLTGRFNETKVTLYRSSPEDAAAWQNGDWRNALAFQSVGRILEYFKRMPLNGAIYEIRFDHRTRTLVFTWTDNSGNVRSFSTGYHYNAKGIVLNTPLSNGNRSISSLTSNGFDAANGLMRVSVNDQTPATITGASAPIRPDTDAPLRWWNFVYVQDLYWISTHGFHVNGVDDAFHIRDIPNYQFLMFWPAFGTQAGVTYDLLGFVINNNGELAIGFGSAWRRPTFTADGKVIFPIYGTLGTPPAGHNAAFTNTNALFADPSGFYLVQTASNAYDMVSAKDARSWISWRF